jgi:hypothetical protein
MLRQRIAVDIGGVCSTLDAEGAVEFGSLFNMPGCIEALTKWKQMGHELFILSFCGKARAAYIARTVEKDFGHLFDVNHVICVPDKMLKSQVCMNRQIDWLLDDNLEVLNSLVNTQGILFRGDPQYAGTATPPHRHVYATSWEETNKLMRL